MVQWQGREDDGMEIDAGRLYKMTEMQEITGVPSSTLKKWALAGKIRAIRTGRLWRIRGDAIQHFLDHGTEEPQQDGGAR